MSATGLVLIALQDGQADGIRLDEIAGQKLVCDGIHDMTQQGGGLPQPTAYGGDSDVHAALSSEALGLTSQRKVTGKFVGDVRCEQAVGGQGSVQPQGRGRLSDRALGWTSGADALGSAALIDHEVTWNILESLRDIRADDLQLSAAALAVRRGGLL